MSVASVMRGECVWCGKIGFIQHPEWIDPCCMECAAAREKYDGVIGQIDMFAGQKYNRLHDEFYIYGDDCPRGACR